MSKLVERRRKEQVTRKEWECTDGRVFKTQAAALSHQHLLNWTHAEVGEPPENLGKLRSWVDRLIAEHGPDALLVVDSGYDGHEFRLVKANFPDLKPEDRP